METLSFILGIASVVVIAAAIVAVYAFVKVNKVQIRVNDQERSSSREIENIHRIIDVAVYAFVKVNKIQIRVNDQKISLSREIENIHRIIDTEIQNVSRHVDNVERDIYSQMDSRFDKLENKLTSKKQLLKN